VRSAYLGGPEGTPDAGQPDLTGQPAEPDAPRPLMTRE